MATKSWAPEVLVEGKWSGNGLRFATKEEAEQWGSDLLGRWFVPTDSRAVESDERPTHRLDADGFSELLCKECDLPVEGSDVYCAGHRRLMTYVPGAEFAANE